MRITEKILSQRVELLNEITGNPRSYYYKASDTNKINVGYYHLDIAYGGYSLVQTANEAGGVTDTFGYFRGTKRQLFEKLVSFIEGIELGKNIK